MRIADIMTASVVSVEMDDSLRMVKDIFDNTHFHHLPVLDGGKLFGVVSDRDLLKAVSPNIDTAAETAKDLACLNKKVHQIMSRKPITLTPQADVYEAVAIFNQYTVSCIPVVDGQQKLKGMLSWRDILKALEARRQKP